MHLESLARGVLTNPATRNITVAPRRVQKLSSTPPADRFLRGGLESSLRQDLCQAHDQHLCQDSGLLLTRGLGGAGGQRGVAA